MRWIKHLSHAHADSAICALQEEFGAEAYGVYWNILEDIAAAMEPGKEEPFAVHSDIKWAAICYVSVRRFRKIAQKMADLRLIDLRSTGDLPQISSGSPADRLHIEVRNILKYKDEYSKKSGQTPEQSRERAEREQKRTTPPTPSKPAAKPELRETVDRKPPPQIAEWEHTEAVITKFHPSTDLTMRVRLIETCAQAYISSSDGSPAIPPFTDEVLAQVLEENHQPKQHSSALWLTTAPEAIRNEVKQAIRKGIQKCQNSSARQKIHSIQ